MHIAFKFHYRHNNDLFIRVLKKIRQRSQLPVSLFKVDEHYRIEATGEQHELEALAELVSALVPKSLFLEEYSLIEISARGIETDFDAMEVSSAIACCPECQQKILHTLDPYTGCTVCGFSETRVSREALCSFAGMEAANPEEVFIELVQRLNREGTVTVPTDNGLRRFSLLSYPQSDAGGILICDPSTLSASWMITQGELDTLMMIEKPVVRIKPKLRFRAEKSLSKPFYPLFFADDRITVAFAGAAKRSGIASLFCDKIPALRAVSALGHHLILHTGRDILSWRHPMPLEMPSCCSFGGFHTVGDKNGLRVQEQSETLSGLCLRFISNEEFSAPAGMICFEPAHAALRSVVLENELQGKSLCGIYLSRYHRSQICSFSPKIGYTSMALFNKEAITSPKGVLEAIAQMDEAGERLVANYKNTFPKLFEAIEKGEFFNSEEGSMIVKLWAVAAVVIGLSSGGSIHEACEQLEATALEFGGKSGPRIDYKVLKTDNGYEIDPRLAIRSAMSFKLAGVDEFLLSFGFIDSLADFIAQQAELADANIAIEGVALSGSVFENRQLLMRTINAFSKNYPLFHNRFLGMDGANVAIGAITLGRE